jgi:hypothetical protein
MRVPLLTVGGLAAIGAAGYPMGTTARMGPGYLPLVLSLLLSAAGAGLLLTGSRGTGSDDVTIQWDELWLGMRPLLFSAIGLGQFAVTINIMGLPLATAALVLLISFAERQFTLVQRLVTSVSLALFVYVIFGVILNLPIKMWF